MIGLYLPASPAEVLFLSFYAVIVVAPMAMVMVLSFLVHHEWRLYAEGWRMMLLDKMSDLSARSMWFNSLTETLVVIAVILALKDVGWDITSKVVAASFFVFWAWVLIWRAVYPLSRVVDIISITKFRHQYRQLENVTDGFR